MTGVVSAAILAVTSTLIASPPVQASGATTTPCTAQRLAFNTSLEVKVGQLFMVGNPSTGVSSQVLDQISRYHVGNVFLSGRTTGGVSQTASVTAALRRQVNAGSTANIGLLVSTDQEGGNVQVLRGAGFSNIPSALSQGRNDLLYYSAKSWGEQLRRAGVNMNLAPVADTVPGWLGKGNPPIGYWDRQFGSDSATVAKYSNAFAWGMRAAGVAPTVKHFPGLGVVRANTDTTTSVHDTSIGLTGSYADHLDPFRKAAVERVPVTMLSSAIYDRLDPARPAMFSPYVTTTVLRKNVGFTGLTMTDDIGAAAAVRPWSYAARAYYAINAGIDLILTVTPAALPQMYASVIANARKDATFGYKVNAAAYSIYRLKQSYGLLPSTC